MAIDLGADVSTFPDLNVTGQQTLDARSVAECTLRRWLTAAGSLAYDRDAGYDLRDLLNDDLTAADLRRHEALAAIEAEKDERVRSMTVKMTLEDGFRLVVRARGQLINDREFSFTAAITQISAEFLASS